MAAPVTESPTLTRLRAERAQALDTITQIITGAEEDAQRDLSAAEADLIERTRKRIADELDPQIGQLDAIEQLRAASAATAGAYRPSGQPATRTLGHPAAAQTSPREYEYRSAGEVLADVGRVRLDRDADTARARLGSVGLELGPEGLTRAVATQTTADHPGLLPVRIVGEIDSELDASRPLITAFGTKPLGDIPGTKFQRPFISQHVEVGKQAAQLTQLASQALKIGTVDFTKDTYGGVVSISRQDIDWTSPSAWNAILADFLDIYAIRSEGAIAAQLEAAVTQEQELTTAAAGTPTVAELIGGLYGAAAKVYAGSGRMPDVIVQDLGEWARWGTIMDSLTATAIGAFTSRVTEFVTALMNMPRVVSPALSAGATIIGVRSKWEIYEDRIGFLSAVTPANLGIDLAYGGYMASGTVRPKAFCRIVNKA